MYGNSSRRYDPPQTVVFLTAVLYKLISNIILMNTNTFTISVVMVT